VILLDTHVAIWLANDDNTLGVRARKVVETARQESQLSISAISFWEIGLLASRDRIELYKDPLELRAELLDSGLAELPLTGDVALLAVDLKGLHGDPADRFIVATAIAHNATLLTADNKLLRWRHPLPRQNAES
jgi:PIN domain nuclease of toxin-antitoxin system